MAGGLFGGMASGLQSGIQLGQRQQLLKNKQVEQFMKKAKANLDATKERLQEITDPANLSMLIDAGLAKGESLPQIRSSIASAIDQMAGMGNGLYEKVGGQGDYFNTDLLKQKAMTAQGTEALRQAELAAQQQEAQATGMGREGTLISEDGEVVSGARRVAGGGLVDQMTGEPIGSQTEGTRFVSGTSPETGKENFGALATSSNISSFREQSMGSFEFVDLGNKAVEHLKANGDVNTMFAAVARGVQEVKNEAMAFFRFMERNNENGLVAVNKETGKEISAEKAYSDALKFADSLESLSSASREFKSMIVSLAYKAAAAREQGGRFSDQDIENAIKEIGGNLSNPRDIATNINRMQEEMAVKYDRIGAFTFLDKWPAMKETLARSGAAFPEIVRYDDGDVDVEAIKKKYPGLNL